MMTDDPVVARSAGTEGSSSNDGTGPCDRESVGRQAWQVGK
jgi:hypothetical protein